MSEASESVSVKVLYLGVFVSPQPLVCPPSWGDPSVGSQENIPEELSQPQNL